MKLSEKVFKNTCEKLSEDFFKYIKRKITRELNILSKGNAKLIDINTTVNIIIHSLGVSDGNIINMCRNIYEGIKGHEIDMEKLLTLHQEIINEILDLHKCKEKSN